mgnify:CR=1 FL=1|tara:strand:- start:16496 stop:16807 length:312 start_codon:yes stop_codon:yes gene_type:complete
MIKLDDLYPNIQLITKNPEVHTNARVFKIESTSSISPKITVLSDFGNMMDFTIEELNEVYKFSESYLEMKTLWGGIDFSQYREPLKETLVHQIGLLQDALQKL